MKRELIPFGDKEFFEHCVYGKHHKRSFKATSKGILDYIHSARLALNHVEVHHTSYLSLMRVKFLKSKDEAFMAFKHFKTEVLKEKKPEGGSR